MRQIGPYSRAKAIQLLDKRRWEAKALRETREQLTAHVGGAPSVTQKMLIERAAQLHLRLMLLDREAMTPEGLSDRNQRQALVLDNVYRRTLKELGLKPAPAPVETLDDIMKRHQAARGAAE